MIDKYKKEMVITMIVTFLCLSTFLLIRYTCFRNKNIDEPINNIIKYYQVDSEAPKFLEATTIKMETTTQIYTTVMETVVDTLPEEDKNNTTNSKYPIVEAPKFEDDGSIIYDGLTLTELTDKLNKSLNSYLTNTGYYFAKFTKETGLDPYLAVSIVLLETGCKWSCSTITVECNNIGGMKGTNKCGNRSYSKYATLEDGIEAFLNNIYNNYYLKGLTTAEKMSSKYAASSEWAVKVNRYRNEIKAS